MMRPRRPAQCHRRGAILAGVIICLIIVLLLSAAVARSIAVQHRQHRIELQRVQAAWLAESALDRAAARLRADEAYAGETWRVDVNTEQVGVCEIRVATPDDQPERRVIDVSARWPDDPLHRVLEQRQLTINLSGSGDTE